MRFKIIELKGMGPQNAKALEKRDFIMPKNYNPSM